MNSRKESKSVLGRGLDSLIPSLDLLGGEEKVYINCPIENIFINKNQPRKFFDEEKLEELSRSIHEKGIIQPLVVRKINKGYEIITGERRYRAALKLNLQLLPVIIKDISAEDALELSLIENIQREDLNPIEEAETYQAIIDKRGLTHEEVSQRVGKDRSTITNCLRLLKLPSIVKTFVIEKKLSSGHVRALLSIESTEQIIALARETIEKGLSVREVEKYVQQLKNETNKGLKKAKTKKRSEMLLLEKSLRQHLSAKVVISGKPTKGKITISYENEENLNRLLKLLQFKSV